MSVVAGMCACGCGKPTKLGEIVAISEGKSRSQIADRLGMTPAHVKTVIRNPPRYIKGHSTGVSNVANIRRKATHAENRIWRTADVERLIAGRGRYRRGDNQERTVLRQKVVALRLRAFDLRVLAAQLDRPPEGATLALARAVGKDTLRYGRTDPVIDWLREQVGVGWKRDAPFADPKLRSFEGMDLRGDRKRSGDAGWWEDKRALDPQELLEMQTEQRVAELMAASGDPLVARAIAVPDSLTDDEREHLRGVFSVLEHAELSGVVPDLSQPIKGHRDQGGYIHAGFARKKTRHQKVARAQIQKASGRSMRPERKPRQKYKPVEMSA